MNYAHEGNRYKDLRSNCEKCFGLCCVALCFSVSQGFPTDKDAGKPCINLQPDFTCSVHKKLSSMGLKGCTAYDCFGAGQKVSQITFGGRDWRKAPQSAKHMFDTFLIMRQLHEMLWYLAYAFILQTDDGIKEEIRSLEDKTEHFTHMDVDSLLALNVAVHRTKVNNLLRNTSELVRVKTSSEKIITSKNRNANPGPIDYFGSDLRRSNLKGADLRGACLIAANLQGVDLSGADLIGADLRDADLRGANLTNSIFVTQSQINTAKGDHHTKLPKMLIRPNFW